MVPVVRDANRKDIPQIAADTRALVEKARTKRLTPDECTGGSMTLSNLGMFGISSFYAVINPGESCILGVGAIVPKPVVIDGGLCVRQMMNLSLSCDHRVVDGAIGAQFLVAVKDHLEALQPPATA
jgi:pyruvate dehydrogenase E2 component (dihydrolipoamide acetyltransferase)